MLTDIGVVAHEGSATLDDGTALHTFTDPDALRLFIHTWRVLRAQFPAVEFALNDDATIASWSGPATQPTPAQIAAGVAAYRAAEAQQVMDADALRTQIVTIAQSAVGVLVTNLDGAQVRALLIVLLRKNDALDKALKVRPLNEWVS